DDVRHSGPDPLDFWPGDVPDAADGDPNHFCQRTNNPGQLGVARSMDGAGPSSYFFVGVAHEKKILVSSSLDDDPAAPRATTTGGEDGEKFVVGPEREQGSDQYRLQLVV